MKITLAICLLPFAIPCFAGSPQIILSSSTVLPGETLRVEVDGISPDAKLIALFHGKRYRCFPVGPNAQRALIGISLGTEPALARLEIRSMDPKTKPLMPQPEMVTISSRAYEVENITLPAAKNALVPYEHHESVLIHRKAGIVSAQQYWEGVFIPPVQGTMIAPFGLHRLHNGKEDAGFHNGIDLRAPKGEPVLAANGGVVELAASFRAHGKIVLLNHGQGVMTIYLHMSSLLVKPGQHVVKGQAIGKVGSSGVSTAPHVHWQVFVHAVPVDPTPWTENEF